MIWNNIFALCEVTELFMFTNTTFPLLPEYYEGVTKDVDRCLGE